MFYPPFYRLVELLPVLAGSMRVLFIGREILEEVEVWRMSTTSSNRISNESSILLNSSWNCFKLSPIVGGGGIMASSGEEDEKLVAGVKSWSKLSSSSSTASSEGSAGPGTEDDGECLTLSLYELGGFI